MTSSRTHVRGDRDYVTGMSYEVTGRRKQGQGDR